MTRTYFIDIDGVLLKQTSEILCTDTMNQKTMLPGSLEKIIEWRSKGYKIILVTARHEGWRQVTIDQMNKFGIAFDQLIMNAGGWYSYYNK